MNAAWLRHGFWNTLDHAITRAADAATSVLLLWVLAPELFSLIALSQAWIAPMLIVFVCPEITLYREFPTWKAAGRAALRRRLGDIRLFGWSKLGLGLALSFALGIFTDLPVPTLIWAFVWALAPQVTGADREFLRLNLKFTELSFLSLYQKATLLGGTWWVVYSSTGSAQELGGQFGWQLAGAAFFSLVTSAVLAQWRASLLISQVPFTEGSVPKRGETLLASIRNFSTWYHIQGVLMVWILTMDLWALGLLGVPGRVTGLYAVGLKISNFAMALPMALTNLYSVWLGRRLVTSKSDDGWARETAILRRVCLGIGITSLIQWGVLALLGRWILTILARGRWDAAEIDVVYGWMHWILAGGVILNISLPISQWVSLRLPIRQVLTQITVPWTMISLAIYLAAAIGWGASGVATANPLVAATAVLLAIRFMRRFGLAVVKKDVR